jgi:hypothetical protein
MDGDCTVDFADLLALLAGDSYHFLSSHRVAAPMARWEMVAVPI